MRTQKILINFRLYSDAAFVQLVQAIILALTGNLNFPTPQPSIAVITTALDDVQDAMAAAATGGPAETAVKDQKRLALEAVMKQLASYVELVSAGDVAKMLSSGFPVSKIPSPIGPLPKPNLFEAEIAGKGMIKLTVNKIYGAKLYQFEYKKEGDTAWTPKNATRTKLLLTSLESGKEYRFRVLPMGASEVREYSDEITSYAA